MTQPALPRVIGTTDAAATAGSDSRGAVWKLAETDRDLDANLIHLPAEDEIHDFDGPDLDILLVIVGGGGVLRTAGGDITLVPGQLVWLPKGSRRGFQPGADGLSYLTVHVRREVAPLMPKLRPDA